MSAVSWVVCSEYLLQLSISICCRLILIMWMMVQILWSVFSAHGSLLLYLSISFNRIDSSKFCSKIIHLDQLFRALYLLSLLWINNFFFIFYWSQLTFRHLACTYKHHIMTKKYVVTTIQNGIAAVLRIWVCLHEYFYSFPFQDWKGVVKKGRNL